MIALRDIHCHLLPGLDDGPKDHREAVALARTLVDQGIDTVVATPHQLGRYEFNHAELILGRLRQFNELLQREGVDLRVIPGADVRVDERLVNLIREHKVLTLNNGGRYLLLEMPHETRIEARGMINSLVQLGIRPIISHPERHLPAQRHPEMVGNWIQHGALVQITAGSLLGLFDRQAHRLAVALLKRGWVHFVASDTHDLRHRPPNLREAYQMLRFRFGDSVAERLCIRNPSRAIAGEVVPEGVYEEVPHKETPNEEYAGIK